MRLQNKTLSLLIVLVVISLAGLVVLQYVLMANAFELKQQAFRRNVNAALNAVVQQLETGEALRGVYRVAVKDPGKKFNLQMYGIHDDSVVTVSVTNDTTAFSNAVFVSSARLPGNARTIAAPPARWDGEKISYTLRKPQHVLIRLHNQETGTDTVVVNATMTAGEHAVDLRNTNLARGQFLFRFVSDSSSYTMEVKNGITQLEESNGESSQRRTALVESVVNKLFHLEQLPIEQRLDSARIDSVIGFNLRQAGIDLPFAYGVIAEQNDSLQVVHPAVYAHELKASEFKSRLFPNDISFSFNQLALYFPGLQAFLLRQIGVQLLLTVLFMAIIVYCFGSTVRTIIQQKAFSVRLMDFVNNMTHEFKTPISTIAVAVETLLHPAIVNDADKIKRYSGVIQDENTRMRHQVDKILQMAVLEEGTYTLKCNPVNLHEVVAKVAENARLQAGANGGTVTTRFEAQRSTVNADIVHLTNIINNILDNAVKYSGDHPDITITTHNEGDTIRLRTTDNGIGIAEEDQQRVFEKYFRVHTGNVHNVKGFGLGLSYVKLMTEAHGGAITIESLPGKGTTVELSFPLMHSSDRES